MDMEEERIEEGNLGEGEPDERGRWATARERVFVDTGRGGSVEVDVGANFQGTIERIAEDVYGGYFKVFLNGAEIVDPEESPATIEAGMRIAITSYDKVGEVLC